MKIYVKATENKHDFIWLISLDNEPIGYFRGSTSSPPDYSVLYTSTDPNDERVKMFIGCRKPRRTTHFSIPKYGQYPLRGPVSMVKVPVKQAEPLVQDADKLKKISDSYNPNLKYSSAKR